MGKFKYTAKDKDANLVTGVLEAADSATAVKELKKKELAIMSVEEEQAQQAPAARQQAPAAKARPFSGSGKVRTMDLVVFSRQLATLIDAGVPLVMGLNILYDQLESGALRKLISSIRNDIEAGNSLSSAFSKYPDFPPIFSNMVRAGETSGSLNEILEKLADYLERAENLRHKIRGAMVYPSTVISMAILIDVFLVVKVVPTFKGVFESLGSGLPLPTKILLTISNYAIRLSPFIVAGIILTVVLFIRFIKSVKGRVIFDTFSLQAPIVGIIVRKVAIGKFTRTLSTLVRSGVSILDAFEISGKISGNKVIEAAAEQIRINIRAGEDIAGPMERTGKFPVFVVKMIAVGEQTGELEKMLAKISDYYEKQVDESLASLTAMIEPMIIGFLGLSIGFIVVAMFMPIFKLTQAVSGR